MAVSPGHSVRPFARWVELWIYSSCSRVAYIHKLLFSLPWRDHIWVRLGEETMQAGEVSEKMENVDKARDKRVSSP